MRPGGFPVPAVLPMLTVIAWYPSEGICRTRTSVSRDSASTSCGEIVSATSTSPLRRFAARMLASFMIR